MNRSCAAETERQEMRGFFNLSEKVSEKAKKSGYERWLFPERYAMIGLSWEA